MVDDLWISHGNLDSPPPHARYRAACRLFAQVECDRMIKRRDALLWSGAALLTGCVEQSPAWTREYADEVTTRTYRGFQPEQVVSAAETVLRLTDPAVTFAYGPQRFQAQRPYLLYLILAASSGTYFYDVAATRAQGGAEIRINMAVASSAVVPTAAGAQSTPSTAAVINYRQPYDLFFARLDYLLGLRADWVTCADAKAKLGISFGSEPLCAGAVDRSPTN